MSGKSTTQRPDRRQLSPDQRSALRVKGEDHVSLFASIQELEAALGQAQPGREASWAELVSTRLQVLRRALTDHVGHARQPDGLYEEIEEEAPRLAPRLRQLERQLQRLEAEARDLQLEVERVRNDDLSALGAIRSDAERMLGSLREVLAKENDLVFERFEEPPALD